METRCCAPGQSFEQGQCVGRPQACPAFMTSLATGCARKPARVRIEPATVFLGPGDWEAQGVVAPRTVVVSSPFWIDQHEVTIAQWADCERGGFCVSLPNQPEPGQPVRFVTFDQAQAYCRWASGSLATEDQWVLAAAGPKSRRYPWGDTGAVCRRANWGLLDGPCASGGTGPEWAGSHDGDRTPDGVLDMAASVAEWTLGHDGKAVTLGGSWRTRFAAELRTWHRSVRDPSLRADDVGFRCVYGSASPAD